MSIESEASAAAFGAFSVSCTLDGASGRVVLDRDLEVLDDMGRVVDRTTQADFLKSFATGVQHGQDLIVDGTTYKIGKLVSDDGYIVTFEVHQ